MNKILLLPLAMILAAASGCSGESFQSGAPTARLSVPACVVQGSTVVLDASASTDPDGKLVRFIFSLGQGNPDYVVDTPRLNHYFDKAIVVEGGYLPYHLSVTVVDDDGNYGALLTPKLLYVVRDLAHCPTQEADILEADLAVTDTLIETDAPVDLAGADTMGQDLAVFEDQVATDTQVGQDTLPPDTASPDTIQPVDTVGPDTAQPDTAQPDTVVTTCTNIAGKWHVTTRRNNIKQLEMDIDLYQTDCAVTTDGGFLKGNIDQDGVLNIDSNIPALHMENCKGPAAKPAFSVSCDKDNDGGQWTADFQAK